MTSKSSGISNYEQRKKRKDAAYSLLKDMEATAAQMHQLIVAMPPHDLLG